MPSSAVRAGKAYVEISTNNSLLDKGIAAAKASMRRLSAVAGTIGGTMSKGFGAATGALSSLSGGVLSLTGLLSGVAAGAGVLALSKSFADSAGAVDDMAQRTGLAVEEIGGLAYAAKQSGTSVEAVEKAIRKMQATTAGKSGLSTSAQFMALADSIAAIDDPTERAAKAMEVFGKGGADLIPLLSGGSAGIAQLAKEADALGITMSAADAAAGAQLGDTIDRLWDSVSGLANQLGAALAPAMTWIGEQMIGIVSYVTNWIKETRRLAQTFSQLQQWGSIALMGLEMAFREGYQGIYTIWTDLTTWMVSSTVEAVAGVANIFAGIPTAIMNGFGTAITWLTGAWDSTVNYIAKKLLYLYSLFDASVDYEAAAKGMDTDAANRAADRQKSLDAANARRNADLANANAARLTMADLINQGIRADGSQRKADYESRIQELAKGIASTMDSIRSEADRIDEQNAIAERNEREFAATKARMGKGGIPGIGAVGDAIAAKSAGTFSGFAAGALGAGTSSFDRMVDNGKKANALLKTIADNTGKSDDLEFDS